MSGAVGDRRPVLVLVGFMGAGKSTVGRTVADLLGVDFVDTDAELVNRDGRTIPEIFRVDGPAHFRELERAVVDDLLANHGGVVALGGGAVTTEAVRDALVGHRVVHLEISADDGFARVKNSDRPLIEADDPAARYAELLTERADIYASVATIVVDAGSGGPDEVADRIIEHLARELTAERENR